MNKEYVLQKLQKMMPDDTKRPMGVSFAELKTAVQEDLRKIKKATKNVERHVRQSTSGILVIPYSEYVVKGRYTKWKQKCLNEVKREFLKKLLEEWQHFNDTIPELITESF